MCRHFECLAYRYVFGSRLNCLESTAGSCRWSGSEFQTVGSATENAQVPKVLWWTHGTDCWLPLADRRCWQPRTSDWYTVVGEVPWSSVPKTMMDCHSKLVLHSLRNYQQVQVVMHQPRQSTLVLSSPCHQTCCSIFSHAATCSWPVTVVSWILNKKLWAMARLCLDNLLNEIICWFSRAKRWHVDTFGPHVRYLWQHYHQLIWSSSNCSRDMEGVLKFQKYVTWSLPTPFYPNLHFSLVSQVVDSFPDFFIPEFPGMKMQRFPDQNGNGLWLNSL